MQAKKFPEAQAKFEEALKANPGLAEAQNNLAFVLRKQGSQNYQLSMEHYNKAIQLKPKLAEAYMYRGVLYAIMGRKAEAQADLAVLQKMNPRYAKELEEFIRLTPNTPSNRQKQKIDEAKRRLNKLSATKK